MVFGTNEGDGRPLVGQSRFRTNPSASRRHGFQTWLISSCKSVLVGLFSDWENVSFETMTKPV